MEQNLGNETVKSSRRRLSSILKAPRTSMKVLRDEPEEQKEEIAKPVEKKRNSRRVSFASTNNVRVFTNDAKNESPVLASIQNTHEDRPEENRVLRFDDEGSHQIKGLETLLNTPLYLSQHKENFFSDPVLQDDCVDRTMLLGEETGFMNITQSHTITIDEDYEIEEEANQDFSFKVAQNVCGDPNIASQKGLPNEVKAVDSDFNAFLASMRLPSVNTIKIQKSEKELGNVFCPANTSISEIDKENYLPSFLMKQHPGGNGLPQQPRGLQRRRSRVSFVEDDKNEQTMSHTVDIENNNIASFTPTVSRNPGRAPIMTSAFSDVLDDMNPTLCLTSAIDIKMTGNITRNVQAALDQNRSNYSSEKDSTMEMTGAFDVSVREKDHTVSMRGGGQPSIPKVKSMSSLTVIGNGDRNKSGYFQGNLSIASTGNADDLEMTRALDVSIQEKEEALFPKVSRRPAFDAFGNGKKVENRSFSSLIVPAAKSDNMEMTETIVPSSGNQTLSNSRKSLPLASVSRTVQEDERIAIMKEEGLHHIPTVNKMTHVAENVMDHNKSLNHSIAQNANAADMDITQSQTIIIEPKPSTENESFNNFWNFPSASSSRTAREDEDAGSMKKEALRPTSSVDKMPCFNSVKNDAKMDPTNQPANLTVAQTANSADMDITQSQTIIIEPKPSTENESFNNFWNFPSASSSRPAREDEHAGSMKKEALRPTSSVDKMPCFNSVKNDAKMDPTNQPANLTVAQTANSADMDITQSQTIIIEPKPSTENESFNNFWNFPSASSSRTAREDEHAGSMKEEALRPTSSVDKMPCFNSVKNDAKMDPTNQPANLTVAQTANSADMDITQSQTIIIEPKPSTENESFNNFWNFPSASSSRTAREDEHTGSMKKEARCPTSSVRKMPCVNSVKNDVKMDPPNQPANLTVAQTANSADMDITQSQTIIIEPKPSTENESFNNFWNFPSASSSRTAREDEHTGSMKKEARCPTSSVRKMPCVNSVKNDVKMDPANLTIAQTADSDNVEMTQCHTIFLDTKHVSGDQSLSISRKTGPPMSVSGTEDSAVMHMTQVFTGRIILNDHLASKGESILIPASAMSPQHNETDCMDLACQLSPDEMELTACSTNRVSNQTCLGRAVDITDIRVTSSANQTISVIEPMEMTEVHKAPFSVRKPKAFMTRRKSGARMMSLMCNAEKTEADNCQTGFSNSDVMDITQSQTAALDFKTFNRATPYRKSKESLNISSTSFSPDVEGMEITQGLTGNGELKRFVSNEKSKHKLNMLPTAQCCQIQNESDCMEVTCQASASNLAIPCADDEMEVTGCNTISADLKGTLAASALEIKANESALWASTSVCRSTVSSEDQNEVSEAAKCANSSVSPSKHQNSMCCNTETVFNSSADMQVDNNCQMALPSRVMTTDEDDDMQVTKTQSVSLNQREEANRKTSSGCRNEEEGQAPSPYKEQSASSVQLEASLTDSFMKVELHNAKARRRSIADFQMELQNMTQRIQEEQKLMTGSTTAPLPSCTLPEISIKELESSKETASNATPVVKQKNSSFQNKNTTPFSQNNKSFSSRMSLCGVVPKLPKRATVTPNKTMTISTNDLQRLQLEKHFDVAERKSNNETVNINDEEFPEMSSEEDLSESLENCPGSQRDELDGSLAVPIKEESFVNDVFESPTNTSPCFKRPRPEEDPITAEITKKACVSDMGSDCHEAAVQWESNFTRHAAQNPKAKTIEDTGVSESTLRYSQFDSHMDGTLDNLFDFDKKLEDGSMTVNEFLSHFGINFIIHRPRPSALPDICRAGETRTMEDLLKEKYIYHPKQRVYEQDCKNLTEIVERLKEQMTEQEKSLRSINGALQQEICTLSKEQLKNFGSKLKERRAYFGKRSKAFSHEMKAALYTELIKTTQDSKLSLISKIKETDEMTEDLDGCIKDLETELASVNAMITGDLDPPQSRPALKAKEEDLQRLNSAITNKESEIGELEIQLRTVKSQQEKLRGESSSLKSHLATLNSLNEWRLDATDEKGALFSFLHKTVLLQVNLPTPAGKEWMNEDVERNIDVCFQLQLDVQKSECHASMVHKLLAQKIESQTQWTQRYTTVRHIPELLHNISLVVGRLRLLGEEIHRLKKWGGLRLRILKISCMDTRIHIVFSSLKAFEKFELSLTVTPDYPFGPLHIQDFKKHMGNTRLDQLEEIVSSVKPAKNYLTKVLKKIHDDLLS